MKSLLELRSRPSSPIALKPPLPLAWLQLIRERGRLMVALAGIAFADILMLMQLGFQAALYDSNTRIHQSLQADLVLISPQARNLANMSYVPRRRLYQAMSLPQVERANALYINVANWKNPQTQKETAILVLGFDPEQSVLKLPDVEQQLAQIKMPDSLIFDRASRGDYQQTIHQIAAGQTVSTEIERRHVALVGLFRVGASFVADGSVITSDQNFLRIFRRRQASQVSVVLINLHPGADRQQTAQQLKARLPDDVKVLNHQEFIDFEKNYWRTNTAIGFIFSLGVSMGFLVGVIIVYQILYSDVTDHMAEYATLKAMGYRNGYLLSVVLQQALILALLGYLPGNLISIGLYGLTRHATNLPLYMTIERSSQVLGLTVAMCAISGAIAMRKLSAADPADIF